MNHNDKPPFEVSGKPKKSAVAGKYGLGYSTARHLARMAMKQVIDKSPEMKKYTSKKVSEAYTMPSASQSDHDHVKNQLSSVLGVRSSEEERSSVPAVHRAIKKVSGINDTSTRKMSKAILRSLVQKHKIIVDKEHRQMLNQESADQVDEISSMAHARYRDAARKDIKANLKHINGEYGDIASNIVQKRMKGLSTSVGLQKKVSSSMKEATSAYSKIDARFKKLSGRSLGAAAKEHGDEAKRLQKEIEAQQAEIDRRKAAMKNEENLDELSKSTLGSYVKKASTNARINSMISKDFDHKAMTARKPSTRDAFYGLSSRYKKKAWKRTDNVAKAVDRLTKEEVEQIDEESLTAGKRLISKHGEGSHTARVYKDTEYNEYQVHHYKDGKHMGEGPVSYHDDKEDAENTAKISIKKQIKEETKMKTFQFFKNQLVEKTLTSAEMKKREEVAKAIERDQPGMPMSKKMAIATSTAKKVAESNLEEMHYCAKHVYSDLFGEGLVVEGEHSEPNIDGSIDWYSVKFRHGVEKVFTEDVKVMFAEYHMNHKRNKMGESSKRKADVKETVKHPNQQVLDVHEPEKDKITAKDFEMLRKIKKNRTK